MLTTKVALLDDEPLALEELKHLLGEFAHLEIVYSGTQPKTALAEIERLRPDLLLLDIQMPGMNGFELLEQLERVPRVIFVTAYDQFALKAFELNALDYLLKPIDPERLREALKRFDASRSAAAPELGPKKLLDPDRRIFVKDGERCAFIHLFQIELIESEGNYSRLFYGSERILLRSSLNQLEERLPEELFFRANRQQIVNLDEVTDVEPWFNQSLRLVMRSGAKIELSQRQSVKFKERMGLN
ncbi:response regulator [bacterium]|nr:response regulator [bacterium]